MPRMRTVQVGTGPELPPRERLLRVVLHGELTPARAEAEAKRLGLGQLAAQPDPARFDPKKEEWWTLTMAIAWIVGRTTEAVRNQWDAWRSKCLRWEQCRWTRGKDMPDHTGHDLTPVPPASWPLLALDTGQPQRMTPREAHHELWKVLGRGTIEANAIDVETRKRVAVPWEEWKGLTIFTERGKDVLRSDAHSRSGYRDVWLPSAAVVDGWPAGREPDIGRSPKIASPDQPLVGQGSAWMDWSPEERDLLIERVRTGEISREAAEAEAREKRLEPLATTPSPGDLDPFEDSEWSIPMVLAWIAFRSPDRVREFNDAWRSECWFWAPRKGSPNSASSKSGWALIQKRPVTVMALQNTTPLGSETETLDLTEMPWKQLWPALREGAFEATGIDTASRKPTVIAAELWTDLVLKDVRRKESLCVRFGTSPSEGFDHVRIGCAAVLSAWPETVASIERLPDLVFPDGPGFMPFSAAAQWIGMKGGAVDIGHDTKGWDDAYRELTHRIASADVACTGVSRRNGQRQRLEPELFGGMKIHHLFGSEEIDAAYSQELYLCAAPNMDEEHWEAGLVDDLRTRHQTVWSKLMVSKADIAKWWPFGHVQEIRQGPPRTGAPGAPSTMSYILAEHAQRCESGLAYETLVREAEHLESWFRDEYRDWPCSTRKTIENRIRQNHRRWRSAPRN